MKHWFVGLCLVTASGCSGSDGPGDAGACVNTPACTCNDGTSGRKVCDLDTHDYVMCECGFGTGSVIQDAGTSAASGGGARDAAADGVRGGAGQAAAPTTGTRSPGVAAGSGGAAGAAQAGRGQSRGAQGNAGRRGQR